MAIAEWTAQIEDALLAAEEETGGNPANSDPEIWEHLLEDVKAQLADYTVIGGAEESNRFQAFYAAVKRVADEALIPSDLNEGLHVMEVQVAPILLMIAQKDSTVGSVIYGDLQSWRANSKDADMKQVMQEVTTEIRDLVLPENTAQTSLTRRINSRGKGLGV